MAELEFLVRAPGSWSCQLGMSLAEVPREYPLHVTCHDESKGRALFQLYASGAEAHEMRDIAADQPCLAWARECIARPVAAHHDGTEHQPIGRLEAGKQRLYGPRAPADGEVAKVGRIKVALDQHEDLRRPRRTPGEVRKDPNEAEVCPARAVNRNQRWAGSMTCEAAAQSRIVRARDRHSDGKGRNGSMAAEHPSWREWMRAAQRGDRKLYAALLAAILPQLRQAARGRWPKAQVSDIEDVVQETLLALHVSRHLYDPARPFLPFLLGIMRFRGADVMRRKRRAAARERAIAEMPETSPAFATKGGQEEAADVAGLRAAIRRLPAGQRRAVEMTKLAELSLQEGAVASGLSVTAIKVATHRGVRALRRLMNGSG